MRLRNWISVVIGVALLAAATTIGVLVNRSALDAADTVHRADTRALVVNNGTLVKQLQLLSAAELAEFVTEHPLTLRRNSATDRALMTTLTSRSLTFGYGAALTDLTGTVLTATRAAGLPPATDAGWIPLRKALMAGQPGFSSLMTVNGKYLQAVAVPVKAGGVPAGLLIGFNEISTTALQKYVDSLHDGIHVTTLVDSTGTIAQTDAPRRMGTKVDAPIRAMLTRAGEFTLINYTNSFGVPMIASITTGLPGGGAYVRAQTLESFQGSVHRRSNTLNWTLAAMLLIGVAAITGLGYRSMLQRRRSDERFEALFQHAPDLVSIVDRTGIIRYSSPSAGAVLGYPGGSMTGSNVFDLVHQDELPDIRAQFVDLLEHRDAVLRVQCRARTGSGVYRWFDLTVSNQLTNPSLHGVVINARDVTDSRAVSDRLAHEAAHDPLTGLPNRRRMQDALGASLSDEPVAVLFVDLDGFKPVNDMHGHEAGDDLLRQVATRLSACVREQDVLARVGGDEFVVLMPGVHTPADAHAMRVRISDELSQPFVVGGHRVQIGASVGVHLAPPSGDPDEALRAADHAMYAVKNARKPAAVAAPREPVPAPAYTPFAVAAAAPAYTPFAVAAAPAGGRHRAARHRAED